MTTTRQAVDEAADRLSAAMAEARPCPPVRDLIGSDDVDAAYEVQERLLAERVAAGARRVGRKIGLTSPAVQAQLGVDQPDFGTLLDDMAVDEDEPVAVGRLLQPKIEAEIAFVLAHAVETAHPTVKEIVAAVAHARPALEIVDSRIADWDISLADTIADNASSALFVLGESTVSLEDLDTVDVRMQMRRNGEVVSKGSGADCLGDPLLALQWLARMAVRVGRPLQAGEIVLSGALGPMVAVSPGDSYDARMTGLGPVRAVFAPAETDGDRR